MEKRLRSRFKTRQYFLVEGLLNRFEIRFSRFKDFPIALKRFVKYFIYTFLYILFVVNLLKENITMANTKVEFPKSSVRGHAEWEEPRSLFHFMQHLITKKKKDGKIRTSETYTSAFNSFRKFRKGKDINLESITRELMEEYETWLKERGLIPNSISFYMRILRAVYNRAVEDEIIDDRHPFRKVYTGIDKTIKRALPLHIIRKIKALNLSIYPELDYARDMFMMSFYLRGMSFVDMAFLKKTDFMHGSIIYRRRKTGQQLIIGWEPEMQTILDKYPENKTGYLLPIITAHTLKERNVYRNKAYAINRGLKRIGEMIGIYAPVTMYVARHSWASIAKAQGIPINIISQGMGHDSEATTLIYLASLDTSQIDRANAQILHALQ